jgi:hypothetical protein
MTEDLEHLTDDAFDKFHYGERDSRKICARRAAGIRA